MGVALTGQAYAGVDEMTATNSDRIWARHITGDFAVGALAGCAMTGRQLSDSLCAESLSEREVSDIRLWPVTDWRMRMDLALKGVVPEQWAESVAGKRPCLTDCGAGAAVRLSDGRVWRYGADWFEPDERKKGYWARKMLYANEVYGWPMDDAEKRVARSYDLKYPPSAFEMLTCDKVERFQGRCAIGGWPR